MNVPIRILIVDDHQIMRDTLKAILQRVPNIKVVQDVENGMEAINALKLQVVDLVLMDISMPFMDGIKATRSILKSFPDMKILGLTMHDDISILSQMMQAGAMGYLIKPVGKDHLMEAISSVMQGKCYFGFQSGLTPSNLHNSFIY